jgi:hypothetical protein
MMAPVPPDRHAALMARVDERLHRSHQLAQQIGESLLLARDATWRSRALLARYRDGNRMHAITRSWEEWRAVIAAMREHGLPYELEHAAYIERLLDRYALSEPMITLSLTDDVYVRSSSWARLRLGIPLLPMER